MGVLKPCCITAGVHTRALTAPHPIKPTSRRCLSAWQPNPGRGSTYRRGKSVQTSGTTSRAHSECELMSFGGRIFLTENRCPLFRKMLQRCSQQTCLLSAHDWFGPGRTAIACRSGDVAVDLDHGRRRKSGRGRGARRRHRARDDPGCPDGRPGVDRRRTRILRPHLPPDRQRAPRPSWSRRGWWRSPSRGAIATTASHRRWSRTCWKASSRLPPSRCRRAISRAPSVTRRCASRAPVTTIWPARSASPLRMRSAPTATSSSARTAAR